MSLVPSILASKNISCVQWLTTILQLWFGKEVAMSSRSWFRDKTTIHAHIHSCWTLRIFELWDEVGAHGGSQRRHVEIIQTPDRQALSRPRIDHLATVSHLNCGFIYDGQTMQSLTRTCEWMCVYVHVPLQTPYQPICLSACLPPLPP